MSVHDFRRPCQSVYSTFVEKSGYTARGGLGSVVLNVRNIFYYKEIYVSIKVFAVPGDYRDDFSVLESQVNTWIEENHPAVLEMHVDVTPLPQPRDRKEFMMTLVVRYE